MSSTINSFERVPFIWTKLIYFNVNYYYMNEKTYIINRIIKLLLYELQLYHWLRTDGRHDIKLELRFSDSEIPTRTKSECFLCSLGFDMVNREIIFNSIIMRYASITRNSIKNKEYRQALIDSNFIRLSGTSVHSKYKVSKLTKMFELNLVHVPELLRSNI